jgi:type IV secretory pathway component VirB8
MENNTPDDFYDERHINYAKAKAYINVTVEKLTKEVAQWRSYAGYAIISSIISVCVAGYVFVTKEVVPILVKYNETTGQVTVSTVDAQEIESLSAIDALYKHWITKFITCAETYDKEDQKRLYRCVKVLTSNKIFNEYKLRFERSDKDNWFERYGDSTTPVRVASINKIPKTEKELEQNDNPRWIVKFSKEIKQQSGKEGDIVPYSAILETNFVKIARNESDIRVNPLNFTVFSYRVDRETAQQN